MKHEEDDCTYVRQNFHKCPGNLIVFSFLEESRSLSFMPNTSCSTNSMYKLLNLIWQVIVDNMPDIIYVQATGSNICGNKNWTAA